jgi:hypothetical protein
VSILVQFKIKLVPMLLAAALMSLSVDLTFAVDRELRTASTILSEAVPDAVTTERVEHGL